MVKGLYSSGNEHDACGVGMVVNIHGNKSHELVDNALKVLENMRHRGAEGADNKTGDGAGIMLQIPHEFILLQGIPAAGYTEHHDRGNRARRTVAHAHAQCAHQPRMPGRDGTGERTRHQAGVRHGSHRRQGARLRAHAIYNKEENRKESDGQGLLYLFALKQEHRIQGHAFEHAGEAVFP